MVNNFKSLSTYGKSSILDVWLYSEYVSVFTFYFFTLNKNKQNRSMYCRSLGHFKSNKNICSYFLLLTSYKVFYFIGLLYTSSKHWLIFSYRYWILQNQPSIGVLIKSCFEKLQQIYRRTLMPKCDFNKVARHKITLRYGCFPVDNICCIFSVHFFLRTFLRASSDSYWLIFDYWHIAHKPSTKNTALNTVVSLNFLVWKFCAEAQFPQSLGRFVCVSLQNFHTRKLGETIVLYAVELQEFAFQIWTIILSTNIKANKSLFRH